MVAGTGDATRAHLAWRDSRNRGQQLWTQRVLLDGVAPTTPGNVRATGEDTSILLQWDAATDATGIRGYQIFRATAQAGPFTRINPLLVAGTSYRDVELGWYTLLLPRLLP